jgi:hypothetical protein
LHIDAGGPRIIAQRWKNPSSHRSLMTGSGWWCSSATCRAARIVAVRQAGNPE